MAHALGVLSEFQSGETRMIFARYRDGRPGLFLLPEGEAQTLRAFTKAELTCPVPGCPTPTFTTVRRRLRGRDGFRHLDRADYEHSPESQFHIEAKAQLAQWARTAAPAATVTEELASDARRSRVADVMIVYQAGSRTALEVQYSALAPDDWQKRHDSYTDQRVHDVWIFGHVGAQLRLDRQGESRVELTPTQQLAASLGTPLLWFNPILLLVGALDPQTLRVDHRSEFPLFSAELRTYPLADFTLHLAEGMVHPALAADHRAVTKFIVARQREAEQQREAARRAAAEAADREAELQRLGTRAELLDRGWADTSEGQAALARFAGVWPKWLGADPHVVTGVPPRMWQYFLLETVIDRAAEGQVLVVGSCARTVAEEFGIEVKTANYLVDRWFRVLASHRVIRSRPKGRKWSIEREFLMPVNPLVKPVVLPPQDRPGMSRERLAEIRAGAGRRRGQEQVANNTAVEQFTQNTTTAPADRVPAQSHVKSKCSNCGYPLHPMFVRQGHHDACMLRR